MANRLSASSKFVHALVLLLVISGSLKAQSFKAPQHDARIVIGLALPEQQVQRFYDVYYGHNIRLGEFPYYCGDPLFLVHVNVVPTLNVQGQYPADGNFAALITAGSGINAKVYEKCFGFDHPSAGGTAQVSASVGALSNQTSITVNGTFVMGSLMGFPVLTFPISSTIPLPTKFLDHIPVKLDDPQQRLDFGSLTGNVWTSSGIVKDIPILARAGAIGSSANGSTFLVLDAVIGSQQPIKDFTTSSEARSDFESDQPALPTENVAVGVRKTFFGGASPDAASSGFLGQLLPIRVSEEGSYKILFWTKKIKWQAVIDTAAVRFTKNEGKDAIEAQVGSHFAIIGKHRVVGKGAINSVTGRVLFDRLRNDNGTLDFRVADFNVKIKFWRFLVFRIRLSSGQLEQQLNGGSIPFATVPPQEVVSLPDDQYSPPCVNTGWDKMKADYRACNDPGQRIGWLSFERGYGSGSEAIGFVLDPSTISDPRLIGDELEIGGQIKSLN
jgi:hypothetical protein